MSTLNLLVEAALMIPTAEKDFIGTTSTKVTELKDLAVTGGGLMVVLFALYKAWVTKFAMAALLGVGLSMGLFLWLITNATDIKDRWDGELNSAPAGTSVVVETPGI